MDESSSTMLSTISSATECGNRSQKPTHARMLCGEQARNPAENK